MGPPPPGDITSYGTSPDASTAVAQYDAAMRLASELDMRPLMAHCDSGLGRLYRRMGNAEPAQEHLAIAPVMYGERGMTYWLENLESG